jgi:hypothetical protein
MKSYRFAILLCTLLLVLHPSVLSAVENVRLDLVLHAFKDADFGRIVVGADTPAVAGQRTVFSGPVTVAFDQKTLALNGAEYVWNGGPPAHLSVLSAPTIITSLGKPATIMIAQPVQYLEKAADGRLQVREIPRDSPDLPHYQMTFDTRRTETAADFIVSCQLDIAMLQGREKIPGVELEVGRPILARFKDTVEFRNPTGRWSGLLIRCPGGSDYSLLVLLKVSPFDEASLPARPMKPVAPPK